MKDLITRIVKVAHGTTPRKAINTMYNLKKTFGWKALFRGIQNKLHGRALLVGIADGFCGASRAEYDRRGRIILEKQQNELSVEEQMANIELFAKQPLMSIVIPLYNAPVKWLEIALESVENQSYRNWELCLVDDGSLDKRAISFVQAKMQEEKRIRFHIQESNGGISSATNKAIEMASGEYVVLMDQDDELTPDALYWCVEAINLHADGDLFYSDECKTGATTKPSPTDFFFKPDWSPELLINSMYIGHLSVYKSEFIRRLGEFRSKFDFSQDYDMALRASCKTDKIYHIERVLYYWRTLPTSGASGGKDYARISNIAALSKNFEERGIDAAICLNDTANYIKPIRKRNELVSVIIPTDSKENLEGCIEALMRSTYSNYEIIPVVNSKVAKEIERDYGFETRLKICKYDKIYNFSDKCNEGAAVSKGRFLIFFNDDVVPMSPDWVERLLEVMEIPGVGGVSPTLVQPNMTIQYSGMITGVPGMSGTAFNSKLWTVAIENPYNQFLIKDVSVLSGACVLMRKSLFDKIGGFDSVNTPNGHSDVDLSFKILDAGYRCVCTPYSLLMHMGNHSWEEKRKADKSDIFCLKRWGKYIQRDKYFTDSMKELLYDDFRYRFKIFSPEKPIIPTNKGAKDFLLLSHQLTRTGAPFVLKELAGIILKNGDYPIVMSPSDGPLRNEYNKMGITVIIDESMENGHWMFEHFARNFDVVIANTLGCSRAVEILKDSLPSVFWWIHEGEFAFKHFKNSLPTKVGKNVKLYLGSPYCERYCRENDLHINGTLIYGQNDLAEQVKREGNQGDTSIKRFLLVGSIEERKGQDVLLEAIEKLEESYLAQCEFLFIGSPLDGDLTNKVKEVCKKYRNVEYIENTSYDELLDIYSDSSCVLVPSRDDPMPVVATDAFMLEKICICSTRTGTVMLAKPNENALSFESENADDLATCIRFVLDNPEESNAIGKRGRQVYNQYFTYSKFVENFNRILAEDFGIKRENLK